MQSPLPEYNGLLFIGDPHLAASPPGWRMDDYCRTILGKLSFALDLATQQNYLPIILGDLFHLPRNNPNHLLVDLVELFRPVKPWVLVGNHDKHEARLTRDVSLAVLAAAQVVTLLAEAGPVGAVSLGGRRVLIGASPDWTPLPQGIDPEGYDHVVWVSHHDLQFPDYDSGRWTLKELPGIDLVVNGHIHTPKPPQRRGRTLWCNPGGISRLSRSIYTQNREPAVSLWRPGLAAPEVIPLPHRPFAEVFLPFPEEAASHPDTVDESLFIRGLENLMMRKTTEGVGLKSFLEANLNPADPIDAMIWELYEEVMHGQNQE
ncbi:MAG: metallophosphoesterase [Deltaproteobacteria bacterium]|nr:metallophosphoesterase [Deltaproteobacteria bacterium]